MRPRTTIHLAIALAAVLLLAACSPQRTSGDALLPEGLEDARVPNTFLNGYIYVAPQSPLLFSSDILSVRDAQIAKVEALVVDLNGDHATRITFDGGPPPIGVRTGWAYPHGDTITLGPDSPWGRETAASLISDDSERFASRYSSEWSALQRLPAVPPERPIAAGFLRNYGELFDQLTERAGAGRIGLSDNLALARIGRVVFVAYSDSIDRLPAVGTRNVLTDMNVGVIAYARSSYPGFIVDGAFDRVSTVLGLSRVDLNGGLDEARYRSVAHNLHVIARLNGSEMFFAIADSRERAEALIASTVG